jgi:hypothetical protein
MFKIKELANILIVIILFAFIISFLQDLNAFLTALLIAFIIIAVNVLSKKIMASYLDSEIEQKVWQWQRWGYYARSHLKKPIPAGIIFPFILIWISYPIGFLKVLTFLQFDVKPTSARAAKRHGLYKFTEMTEWHIAAIAGIGIFANLVLAVIAYMLGYSELARFSIYFSVWNLLPVSQLDGSRIFFGSKILWVILAVLSLIGLGYALFLV